MPLELTRRNVPQSEKCFGATLGKSRDTLVSTPICKALIAFEKVSCDRVLLQFLPNLKPAMS